jgi:hypothetical protein
MASCARFALLAFVILVHRPALLVNSGPAPLSITAALLRGPRHHSYDCRKTGERVTGRGACSDAFREGRDEADSLSYRFARGTDPVSGGVWAWQALQSAQAVQLGSSLSGFSFTTDAAPTQLPLENYFFLSDSFDRIQVGNISAPEVAIAHPVPEPSTWAMMLLGFAGIGFIAYRGKSKATLIDAGSVINSLN